MKSGAVNAFSRYNMKSVIEIKGNPDAAPMFWSGESVAIIDHSGEKIDQSNLFIT
jgi:fructose-1,6-bisphosphatase/sedoheptulose 1,7-bisphosphatase-like protein